MLRHTTVSSVGLRKTLLAEAYKGWEKRMAGIGPAALKAPKLDKAVLRRLDNYLIHVEESVAEARRAMNLLKAAGSPASIKMHDGRAAWAVLLNGFKGALSSATTGYNALKA